MWNGDALAETGGTQSLARRQTVDDDRSRQLRVLREQLGDLLEQALLGRGPGIEQDVGLLQQWANTIHGLGILHDIPPDGERI
jgi:hypothetical protein